MRKANPAPLPLVPYRQRPSYCGPASLKIALAYFGIEKTEAALGRLCRTTLSRGTGHGDLLRGARRSGARAFMKENGSLTELSRWVHVLRLPVVVGWTSPVDPRHPTPDDEHYSVVMAVTRTSVVLMDPELDRGRRRLSRKRFLSLWHDSDGPNGRAYRRWYMVLDVPRAGSSRGL